MSLFEGFGKKITTASQDVAQQTKKLSELSRLSSEISGKEREMDSHLITLGKEYYLANHAESNHESVLKVKELRIAIKQLKGEVVALKGSRKCGKCQSDVALNHAFCPFCGDPMP